MIFFWHLNKDKIQIECVILIITLASIPLKSVVISNSYYLLGAYYYLVRALHVILLLVIN